MPTLLTQPTHHVFISGLFEPLREWQRDYEFIPEAPLLVNRLSKLKAKKSKNETLLSSIYALLGNETLNHITSHAQACYHYEMGNEASEVGSAAASIDVLCAAPIELEAGMSDIVIGQQIIDDLTAEECQQLAHILNNHFNQDGWEFVVSEEGRWFLLLPEDNKPENTLPIQQALGASLRDLVEGNEDVQWSRQLNELQMLLYGSMTNQQRESNRQRAISSFWLWDVLIDSSRTSQNKLDFIVGGGYDGKVIANAYDLDWTESLAPNTARHSQSGIYIADELQSSTSINDLDSWQSKLSELESFLMALLDNETVNTIIYAGNGLSWSSVDKNRWRFFTTRKKTLLDIMGNQ